MKNNKGFTLVEIISVVVILGLLAIISIPIVSNVSDNIKKKTLNTKIENIEKAAVLYGQNHRENFNTTCNGEGKPCYNITGDCKCYEEIDADNNIVDINVEKLISEGLIEEDATVEIGGTPTKVITNSLNEEEYLNNCQIQIYQKYGKIYATYLAKNTDNETCWYKIG